MQDGSPALALIWGRATTEAGAAYTAEYIDRLRAEALQATCSGADGSFVRRLTAVASVAGDGGLLQSLVQEMSIRFAGRRS